MYGRSVYSAIKAMFEVPNNNEPVSVPAIDYSQFMKQKRLFYDPLTSDDSPKTIHQCHQCNKIFVSFKGLQQHSIIHTNEKPFKCNICFKSFRFKSNLFEHKSVHSGFTPHKCPYCDKTCRLKGNLKKHLKTHFSTKEELEEIWKPFSSNRRPARELPYKGITVNSLFGKNDQSTQNKSEPKKVDAIGGCQNWINKIKSGEIVPPSNNAHDSHFTNLIDSHLYKRINVNLLLATAKYTSFENYRCPICDMLFISHQECLDHTFVMHALTQNEQRVCGKCVRIFSTEEEYLIHKNAHASVHKILTSNELNVHKPSLLEPSFGSLNITGDQTFTYSKLNWSQLE
uniref:Zinc finger protein n=1 Tax=Rhabditophanes sp. KR3021 TaxID=114890 RepID=A0AC35TXQ2_9BILA